MPAARLLLAALLIVPAALSQFPSPRPRQKKSVPAKEHTHPQQDLQYLAGILRRLDDALVVIQAQDTRILAIKRTETTKFLKEAQDLDPSEFQPGDHLLVEAKQDEEGIYYAVNVVFRKQGTEAEREAASQPVPISPRVLHDPDAPPALGRKGPSPEPDEPAEEARSEDAPPRVPKVRPLPGEDEEPPPVLRRKRPGETRPSEPPRVAEARPLPPAGPEPKRTPAPAPVEAESAPAPEDPVIAKARAEAGQFTENLPNYICRQITARFVNQSHIVNWRPVDIVTADLIYERGRERYRNITLGGKATKKSMEELPGAWSTGEFGTILADLFSKTTAATFRFGKEANASGRPALVYDFWVDQENSHWTIHIASQTVVPAYTGSVWIDKQTHRVLRVEMQARRIPREFPVDKVESAVDYQYIRFGSQVQFLVPVHAESLMCQRGTSICSLNKIDFRNYQRFTSESQIQFEAK